MTLVGLIAVNILIGLPLLVASAALLPPRQFHSPIQMRTVCSGSSNNDDDSLKDLSSSSHDDDREWQTISEIARMETPWMTLVGERLRDPMDNRPMDYWRVEKEDSLVVVTHTKQHQYILPRPMYRPGVGRLTLDFPGGRVPRNSSNCLDEVARDIVGRELRIAPEWVESVTPLNQQASSSNKIGGWIINSSFNSQKLWGYVGVLADDTPLNDVNILRYDNVDKLLEDLHCLQCRHVLLEHLRAVKHSPS